MGSFLLADYGMTNLKFHIYINNHNTLFYSNSFLLGITPLNDSNCRFIFAVICQVKEEKECMIILLHTHQRSLECGSTSVSELSSMTNFGGPSKK